MMFHENSPWWESLCYIWMDRCDETKRLVNKETDLLDNFIHQKEQKPVTKNDKSMKCNMQKVKTV